MLSLVRLTALLVSFYALTSVASPVPDDAGTGNQQPQREQQAGGIGPPTADAAGPKAVGYFVNWV